jgi:hypothetical protein
MDFSKTLAPLSGYKTYIAAAALAVLALVALADGDTTKAAELASTALGLVGLRHAAAANRESAGDEADWLLRRIGVAANHVLDVRDQLIASGVITNKHAPAPEAPTDGNPQK